MNTKEENRIYKKELTKRNFRYNRYLLLRYSLAVLFFSNVYWGLALYLDKSIYLLLPLSLMMLAIMAISEHVKLYGANENELPKLQWNVYYHFCQLGINILLLALTIFNSNFTELFPVLTNSPEAKIAITAILLMGVTISVCCLKRVFNINRNKDKHYQYIIEFENAYK